MGNAIAKRFDGVDPVLNGPVETVIMFGIWFTALITLMICVQRASGVSLKDRNGDGIPDLQ